METWAIVLLVLGSNIIVAFSTFVATKMQVTHSDKRLERELERAREQDYRRRSREVRSEPLLKLKYELALMSTKLDRAAKSAYGRLTRFNKTEEQAEEEYRKAANDWNDYISGDYIQRTLFLIDDIEIVNLVKKIRNEYLSSIDRVIDHEGLTSVELGKAGRAAEEKIGPEVAKAQGLINKRLEEL